MHTMTSTEFARNPRAVYDLVMETQEPVEITRHGKPVVRVEPVKQKKQLTGKELVAKMRRDHELFGPFPVDTQWQKDYDEFINPYEDISKDPWNR
jgi:prevent-host-death family protein